MSVCERERDGDVLLVLTLSDRHITVATPWSVWALNISYWSTFRDCSVKAARNPSHNHAHVKFPRLSTQTPIIPPDRTRRTLKLQIRVARTYTCILILSVSPLPTPSLCFCLFHPTSHRLPQESPLRQSPGTVSEIAVSVHHLPLNCLNYLCRHIAVCAFASLFNNSF